MPRYTYTCTGCGHETTRIVSFEERDLLTCEQLLEINQTDRGVKAEGKAVCGAPLKRAEIETTAFTPYGWRAD
jgi:putative FmdB family regulatory protein